MSVVNTTAVQSGSAEARRSPSRPGSPAAPAARSRTSRADLGERLGQLGVIAGAILAWQLASMAVGGRAISPPVDVALALVALASGPVFWGAVWATLACTLIGLAIAAVVGIGLGLLVGSAKPAIMSTRLVVDVLRTIPPVVLVPLVILLFGPTWTMQIVLIALAAVWPLFVQAIYAVAEIDPALNDVARGFGLSRARRWRHIVLPSALPFLMTGVRVAATIALLLAIAAEFIAAAPGIGQQIARAQLSGQATDAYAYVVVAGALGVMLNLVLVRLSRAVLAWHPSMRGERA